MPRQFAARNSPIAIAYEWNSGITHRMRSPTAVASSVSRCATLMAIERCVRFTPFALPVVPPVYWRSARSSGCGNFALLPEESETEERTEAGCASATISSISRLVYSGLSGTSCAPDAITPNVATQVSIEFGSSVAIRSPLSCSDRPQTDEKYSP